MYTADYFAPVMKRGIPVKLAARSFIIPVPKGAGEFMTYPHDVGPFKKGDAVCNKEGVPKGQGIVFKNYTDGAVQAARGDGKSMIIVNAISEEQADRLWAYYNEKISDPEHTGTGTIREVLDYAHFELGIDDFFNGDRVKIPGFEKLRVHPTCPDCGSFLRRSDEMRRAVLGHGQGEYKGPAASPQQFNGNVIAVGNEKHIWMVQAAAFVNTYRHADDDREIKLTDLPAFLMRPEAAPAPQPGWAR